MQARQSTNTTVSRPAWWLVLAGASLALCGQAPAELHVDDLRIGFRTIKEGNVVRSGAWVPITVGVSIYNQPAFDGILRVGQFDSDGDLCYDTVEIHLQAEGTNRVVRHLYVPVNPRRSNLTFTLEVLNDAGEIVEVIHDGEPKSQVRASESFNVLEDDRLLILEVSPGTLSRISALESANYTRSPAVAHLAPRQLPEHWIGLEMADCIIWDDAEVEENLTARQLAALLDWTQQGGTLLIASAQHAPTLAQTKALNDVLPADLGEVIQTTQLGALRYRLLFPAQEQARYSPDAAKGLRCARPVSAVRCVGRKGCEVLLREPGIDSDLITRRSLGAGEIIFCGLTLKDMFQEEGSGSPATFLERVFRLQPVPANPDSAAVPSDISLFTRVANVIGFTPNVGIYLLVALLFSLGYVGIATLGVWGFLSARGWRQHNWSIFAVVALGASVLSVLAVSAVQGVGSKVHQLSIIDAEAGSRVAQGTALFGLKTSSDTRVDVWLPRDRLSVAGSEPGDTRCFLRPISEGGALSEGTGSYADPTEYHLVPTSAVVEDVRVRATLKRLEGRWEGLLDGTVTGRLTTRRLTTGSYYDWGFTDDSYIANDLGVELQHCYLIHTLYDAFTPAEGPEGRTRPDRSDEIYVFELGTLPGDGTEVYVSPLCYALEGKEREVSETLTRQVLDKRHDEWSGPLTSLWRRAGAGLDSSTGVGLTRDRSALMLLTTLGEWDHEAHKETGPFAGYYCWTRDRLRQLDLRKHMRQGTALLIGFADDPGPVRLATRRGERPFQVVEPQRRQSWTMYRFRIPVDARGAPHFLPRPASDRVKSSSPSPDEG